MIWPYHAFEALAVAVNATISYWLQSLDLCVYVCVSVGCVCRLCVPAHMQLKVWFQD